MRVSRIYKNSSGDTIRIDELSLSILPNERPAITYKREGSMVRLGPQRTKIMLLHGTGASRTIADIEIAGEYDDIDSISGDYTWVTKTLGDGTVARIDMSGLPGIGAEI